MSCLFLAGMEPIAYAKVSAKKQITIPMVVQKFLGGVEPSDCLLFYQEKSDGSITIKAGQIDVSFKTKDD